MSNRNWMTDLDERLKELPLIYLAIPGSHNSMTYGINSRSKVAPDAEPVVRRLNFLFPWIVRRWSKNQSVDVLEQLELGVRYFDLRLVQNDDKFYFAHGLFSMEIYEPLSQIDEFVKKNADEVVILDFQHFYSFEFRHHILLHKMLRRLFENRFYTINDGPLSECTLNRCKLLQRNVILIYRRSPILLPFEFWPSNAWPTPWPNLSSVKALEEYLDTALATRKPIQGYVTQCVLTPTSSYIVRRFYSSLVQTAKKVNKTLHPWINSQSPGSFDDNEEPKVNVFIADFVELNNGEFCNAVIALNKKLCEVSELNHMGHTSSSSSNTIPPTN